MTKKSRGRKSEYTPEIGAMICERIALGESVRTICADPDTPAMSTVFKWLNVHKDFVEQYARAKEEQADAIFDEILDIADNSTNDYMTRKNADGTDYEAVNQENIQRARLRIDARKWMAGKLRPKKYGEKIDHNVSGALTVSVINFSDVDDDTDTAA